MRAGLVPHAVLTLDHHGWADDAGTKDRAGIPDAPGFVSPKVLHHTIGGASGQAFEVPVWRSIGSLNQGGAGVSQTAPDPDAVVPASAVTPEVPELSASQRNHHFEISWRSIISLEEAGDSLAVGRSKDATVIPRPASATRVPPMTEAATSGQIDQFHIAIEGGSGESRAHRCVRGKTLGDAPGPRRSSLAPTMLNAAAVRPHDLEM